MATAIARVDIIHSASDKEWEDLYKWVEDRTLSFNNTDPDTRNPWLAPDISREAIIKKIHGSEVGGWLGAGFF